MVRFWGFLSTAISNSATIPAREWSVREISVVLGLLLLLIVSFFFLYRRSDVNLKLLLTFGALHVRSLFDYRV